MATDRDPVISAQVLLNAAGGTRPRDADLTAERIQSVMPAPAVVAAVTDSLARAGFDVGRVVGLSFSIAARRSLFDSFFGLKEAGASPGDIPRERIPPSVRSAVAAITFPPPPEFGPGKYS